MRRREVLLAAAVFALPGSAFGDDEVLPDTATAEWLAGVKWPLGEAASREWIAYAAQEDERWALAEQRLHAMRAWSKRELLPLIPKDRPVVYPFGGPDAFHALALFADAPSILLIGLEPVRSAPDRTRQVRPGWFTDLGRATADLFRLTFFRTRDLTNDMREIGVLPILLGTIVRMGGRVTQISPVVLGRVAVDWVASDGRTRRLEYVQVDLSSSGLAKRPDFVASLRALAPFVTFIKAASYLLAEPGFAYIRKLLLEESAAVVQDDTGIPFRDIDAGFATRHFGRYVPPGPPFAERLQPQLEAAVARQPPSPIPFGIGYHIQAASSNLMVATRLSP